MTRPTVATTLGAAVAGLSLAVASLPGAASAHPAAVGPTKVISDCQRPHYEPRRIVLTCGDRAQVLTRLRYGHWGASRATGAGRFVYNDCVPSCAKGHYHHFHVTITLKRVRTHRSQRLFTRLVTHHKGHPQPYSLPTSGG